MEEKKTLLQMALEETGSRANSKNTNEQRLKLHEECELALAYLEDRISAATVSKVTGIHSAKVSAWYSGKIMKGIRNGVMQTSMTKGDA